jgi:signal transduction histidine kinase/ActR/RegA family two-component response regulator
VKLSLQTRVALFIALIVITVSVISTYLFMIGYSRSEERGLIARGDALGYSLSKAAETGLINEDLDLIRKASNIVKAPDVTLAQVFSGIWDGIESFPLEKLKDAPDPAAVSHFRHSKSPFVIKMSDGYDFYNPILFQASPESSPVVIGFVRIVLSSAGIREDLRRMIILNVVAASFIALFAIISINYLIGRFVISPVMSLYKSILLFKDGVMPNEGDMPRHSAKEIGELTKEFNHMCREIREKEEKVAESGRRIQALFDRVQHGIFRLDRKGSIVESNSRFREMFGDVSELCDILIGETHAPDCLRKAIAERGLHIEDSAIGKGGEQLMISLTLYPEYGSDEVITAFDGYVIDVTESKMIQERLFRAQKMEAVGTLAGGMAHDFNNLLTAILGYAEIILSMTHEGDQFNKPATIIYEAAKRGADFGRKILTITRKEKMETKPENINDVVKSSLELLRRSIPKNIEIITRLHEEMLLTKADYSQLQQVVMNLAINAVDAMPEGGRLSIETSLVGADNDATSNVYSTNSGYIKLSVSDSGKGIDTQTQRKIFDPFFTTKELGKGTGLGLYIVHSIVNNHGGYINLYSEPFKGTQFNIYLPVTRDTEAEETFDPQNLRGSETILVIDDEADVRELCTDMLEPLGYTVMRAGDGNAGINIFREMRDKIALVILDMIMPKMGGSEVFQALRRIDPHVIVLLCSGYSQNGFAGIDELLQRGAAGFIQKPFSRQTVAMAIRKALSQ